MEFELNEYHHNISDEELLKDIRRIANLLKRDGISKRDYKYNGGRYCADTIAKRFNGWVNALLKCGLNPNSKQTSVSGIPNSNLIFDLQDVAKKINKNTFTTSEYTQYGNYSITILLKKFGTWNAALKAAGLVPFDHPLGGGSKNKVSQYACLEEIERMWIYLGRQPTVTDIKNGLSKYSQHTYERRFGSWRKALEFFVLYMNDEKVVEKVKESDVVEIKLPDVTNQDVEINEQTHKTKRDINCDCAF